jgi:ABC-type spermidine/putrescine transport system permease subunit I
MIPFIVGFLISLYALKIFLKQRNIVQQLTSRIENGLKLLQLLKRNILNQKKNLLIVLLILWLNMMLCLMIQLSCIANNYAICMN